MGITILQGTDSPFPIFNAIAVSFENSKTAPFSFVGRPFTVTINFLPFSVTSTFVPDGNIAWAAFKPKCLSILSLTSSSVGLLYEQFPFCSY